MGCAVIIYLVMALQAERETLPPTIYLDVRHTICCITTILEIYRKLETIGRYTKPCPSLIEDTALMFPSPDDCILCPLCCDTAMLIFRRELLIVRGVRATRSFCVKSINNRNRLFMRTSYTKILANGDHFNLHRLCVDEHIVCTNVLQERINVHNGVIMLRNYKQYHEVRLN